MFKDEYGILNKNFIFKILFALEIACLPLIISMRILVSPHAMAIFVGVIIAIKIAMMVIKNPANVNQLYLDAVGNIVVVLFVLITYSCYGYINVPLTVICCVLFVLEEIFRVFFFYKPNNQVVDSLMYATELFIFVILSTLLMATVNGMPLKIAVIAMILSCAILTIIQGHNFIYYYVIKKERHIKK